MKSQKRHVQVFRRKSHDLTLAFTFAFALALAFTLALAFALAFANALKNRCYVFVAVHRQRGRIHAPGKVARPFIENPARNRNRRQAHRFSP